MATVKIRNKQTGEVREVEDSQLSSFGVSASPPPDQNTEDTSQASQPKSIYAEGRELGLNPLVAGAAALQNFLGKSSFLPTAGSLLGSAGIPIPGLGSATGTAFGERVRQMNERGGLESFFPTKDEAVELGTKAAGSGILDTAFAGSGKILQKIAGPVASKIKLGLPKTVSESIKSAMQPISEKIDEILSGSSATVKTEPIISRLEGIRDSYAKGEGKKAVDAVNKIIDVFKKTGTDITAEKAYAIKKTLGQDIFGEAGREVTKRGSAGIAEKTAKKVAGGDLSEQLSTNIPELKDLFSQYGSLANTSRLMERPFQTQVPLQLQVPAMLGLQALLGPGAGTAANATVTGLSMPYTRLLLQNLLGKTGGVAASPITRGAGQAGLNYLMNQ